jgi:hypothetical protein
VTTPDQYRVVFDLSQKGFQWWFPAFGLIFAVIGGVFIWLGRRYQWPPRRSLVGYFMVGFSCLWSGLAFVTTFPEYLNLRSAYRHGQFSVVEGTVTDFRPMPYEGHQDECFSVQSETFCYSDYVVTAGFNNSASHGGPIRDGLPVRVSFVANTIVRLEVRSDALPGDAERVSFAEEAKTEWQQRQQRDPVIDRMNLGFAVASLFMVGWWNLQPQRFMRFWLKPPYKPRTVFLFRAFFAANLIGAIWYLVGLMIHHQRPISEYRAAAGIAAIMFAVIWGMFTAMLWFSRRLDQTKGP